MDPDLFWSAEIWQGCVVVFRKYAVDKRVRRFGVTVESIRLSLAGIMQIVEITPLLDAKSLAGYLKVSTRTLETLLGRGEGPPFLKLGRQRRWRHVDVDAWLQDRAMKSLKPQLN